MNTRSEDSQSVLKSISLAAAFFIGLMSMPAMAAVTVKMTSPAANATATEPGSFVLTATASSTGGSIKNVAFYSGTTLLYTDTTSPYTYTWNNVPAGTYVLKAKATDSKNATATSTTVTVTVTKPVQTYYIDVDHLNSPRTVSNSTGTAVWTWDNVDPFGANTPNGNPSGLGAFEFNLRFPGQYFDKETSIHYNFLRDAYDPALGRYTQFDPIGLTGGINGYTYTFNTPIIAIDPTGLYCIFSDGVIIKLTPTSTTRKIVEREWETLLALPVPSPNVPSPSAGFPWPGMELMWQVTKHQSGYLERLFKSTMGGIWRCYDDCGKMTFQGWGTKEGPDQWQRDGNFEESFSGKTHRGGSPSPDDLPRIPR